MWFENERAKRVFGRLSGEHKQAKKQRMATRVLADMNNTSSELPEQTNVPSLDVDPPYIVSQATTEEHKEILEKLEKLGQTLTDLVLIGKSEPRDADQRIKDDWWPQVEELLVAHVPRDLKESFPLRKAVQAKCIRPVSAMEAATGPASDLRNLSHLGLISSGHLQDRGEDEHRETCKSRSSWQ